MNCDDCAPMFECGFVLINKGAVPRARNLIKRYGKRGNNVYQSASLSNWSKKTIKQSKGHEEDTICILGYYYTLDFLFLSFGV